MSSLSCPFIVVFLLLFLATLSLQKRLCVYKVSRELCHKQCCGELGDLYCRDSCNGVKCSKSEDCGSGCCDGGKCSSCNTPWYSIAIPVIIVLALIFIFVVYKIWWYNKRRVIQRGVIVTTITRRFGQPFPHDDSVPLVNDHNEEEEQRTSQNESLPPPYTP
ncbi:uncharacterized protein LOC114518812 [Dendronephthya gigantea]|uniref:uncharacterized protein LOC114518812 n=1 Tax=Dendronephthya gigantea TaxID=151771 RepID=UPI00106A2781|nr:uncharacterized protein LOC114518812 [Dendronephthya gigantea]